MVLHYIVWDIQPEIVNFFGISLRYYGILFVLGLILSYFLLKILFRIENIEAEKLDRLTLFGFIGIFAGARLGHCLFYEPDYFLNHPLEMLLPIESDLDGTYRFTGYRGLASHGGAMGLILAIIFYNYKTKEPLLKTLDLIAIATPLTAIFIRLANLMNSEIIGLPTQLPWGFIFVNVDSIPRHPAQLYEAFAYLISFGVLILLYHKKRDHIPTGFLFGLALVFIFLARFFIEFYKEKQVEFEAQMTLDMGQWLSLPFVLTGLAVMIWRLKARI